MIINNKIKTLQLVRLYQQLSILLASGISLIAAFKLLYEMERHSQLRYLLLRIHQHLLNGKNLHQIFNKYPQVFDALTCQMLKIGESTGRIEIVLNNLADYHLKKLEFKNSLQHILLYPICTLSIALLCLLFMLLYVIPKFAEFFNQSQIEIPKITHFFIAFSECLRRQFGLFFLIFLVIAVLAMFASNNKFRKVSQLLFNITTLEVLHTRVQLLRMNKILFLTLGAGLSLYHALQLCIPLMSDRFAIKLNAITRSIQVGCSFHVAASKEGLPIILVQMIKVGEETGNIEKMLHHYIQLEESSLKQLINHFTQLLEPLIMCVLGALIALLVIAMYLPLFSLGNVI